MKKVFWTIAAVLVFSSLSMAQVPSSPVSFYGGGAFSLPGAPETFRDGWKTGYHGLLGIGYNVAPRLQLIGKLEYHKFTSEADGLLGIAGGERKVLMYGIDGHLALGAPVVPVKPYVIGGIGIGKVQQETFTGTNPLATALNSVITTADESKVYFSFGGGVQFSAGPNLSLFLQARYVNISTSGEATGMLPISVGVKLF